MKITYYGTSASEAWPALFCSCRACALARELGGRNIRSRSQALIDTSLLLDFPPDTSCHVQHLNLNLGLVRTVLVTHSHHDHFFPYDLGMRMPGFAEGLRDWKLLVYGNETTEAKFQEASGVYQGYAILVREEFSCLINSHEQGHEQLDSGKLNTGGHK